MSFLKSLKTVGAVELVGLGLSAATGGIGYIGWAALKGSIAAYEVYTKNQENGTDLNFTDVARVALSAGTSVVPGASGFIMDAVEIAIHTACDSDKPVKAAVVAPVVLDPTAARIAAIQAAQSERVDAMKAHDAMMAAKLAAKKAAKAAKKSKR